MTKIFKTTHKILHLICGNHLEHKSWAMLQSSLLFIQNISPLQFLGSVILHNQLMLTIFGRHHTFYGFTGVGTHVTSNHSFEQEVRDSEFYRCLKTCEDGCPKIGSRASWFHQHNKLKT